MKISKKQQIEKLQKVVEYNQKLIEVIKEETNPQCRELMLKADARIDLLEDVISMLNGDSKWIDIKGKEF